MVDIGFVLSTSVFWVFATSARHCAACFFFFFFFFFFSGGGGGPTSVIQVGNLPLGRRMSLRSPSVVSQKGILMSHSRGWGYPNLKEQSVLGYLGVLGSRSISRPAILGGSQGASTRSPSLL